LGQRKNRKGREYWRSLKGDDNFRGPKKSTAENLGSRAGGHYNNAMGRKSENGARGIGEASSQATRNKV